MTQANSTVTVVIPGDLHLTESGLDNHTAAQLVVAEVNGLIRPDFVQFIGDNVQDATEEQFRLFDELRDRLEVPHFALVGDHDVKDDPGAGRFRAHLGATFGATSLRGFRFLRLDTQQAKPLGIAEEQLAWFRAQVDEATAAGERVVIFQHNYPYQIWESFAGPGLDAWREVVQTRRIAAIFAGHTHYGQVANDGRNVAIATRSIGDPEGGPPGYTIAHLDGENLAVTYRAVIDEGPIVLVTHPRDLLLATGPAHVVTGPDAVRVRVWSSSTLSTLRGRLDDGDWSGLEFLGAGLWTAPLPGDRLAKGEHAYEVEAVDAEGRRGGQRLGFLVDPTGRFTAVPGVRPAVTVTKFC